MISIKQKSCTVCTDSIIDISKFKKDKQEIFELIASARVHMMNTQRITKDQDAMNKVAVMEYVTFVREKKPELQYYHSHIAMVDNFNQYDIGIADGRFQSEELDKYVRQRVELQRTIEEL